jgi:hypothetical protein
VEYSFDELKYDIIKIGHEVEFYYMNEKYSISRDKEGWYLCKFGDENYQSFATAEELISKATIHGKSLEDIWGDVEVETIF